MGEIPRVRGRAALCPKGVGRADMGIGCVVGRASQIDGLKPQLCGQADIVAQIGRDASAKTIVVYSVGKVDLIIPAHHQEHPVHRVGELYTGLIELEIADDCAGLCQFGAS